MSLIFGQQMVEIQPTPQRRQVPGLPERRVNVAEQLTTVSPSASDEALMPDGTDVTIAVMGATGSGKTTFINMASGSNLRIGRGLRSCTNIVQVAKPLHMDGRIVTLIDTPGFDDTTRSDADILRMIAAFLATAYENGKTLAGVIYMHRISDVRMGGISTRNFKMFRQLCGDSTLKNVVIVTNMWGEVSQEVGEARENELAKQNIFFKPVLDKGALMLRHENTEESAHIILRHIIENHPLSLQIQRELVDQKKDISQTAAGEELNRELMLQIQKHKKEMRQLQEEMKEAIRVKDEETRRELELESRKLQAEMNRVQTDAQTLVSGYSEEKRKMEKRMHELVETSRAEAARAKEEHNHQISALQRQLDQTSAHSATEREYFLRQIQELRQQRGGGSSGFFSMIGRALDLVFGIH